ncbi:MAG TPA: purine-nucleoside phosphorylase [Sedimentibacter sp.]|jgi:purine-nucleoside phosphorylase|nr:purine-nucleoside phosphorylase [Tissierellia bacterium]HOA19406.1 purine-nucleoside phosphorylase [Sedimentibacter sp.]HOG62559.1 purine-nucleoside phosphorylase [Sedimentibacter sp.]HOT22310.1 purine-nucleoside phosphorylase [Sedimentibacter sp.]HPY56215.1 purine-nucleoside phosphorylase [Sedimentibacter sp.]
MSTPHNSAVIGQIAETVLLPGDPLRAKFIAENFLEDVEQFNTVRNMYGFTGSYKGKKVSVMGSGMGCASIGIYSYELIHMYGVKNLIRVGSCGAYAPDLNLYDIVLAIGASTDSNYAYQYELPGIYSATASWELLSKAKKVADDNNIKAVVGNIVTTDIFYHDNSENWRKWAKMGCLAVEMETYALYCNANRAGVNALTILTVSDSLEHKTETTPEQREKSFTDMIKIALEIL